MSYLKSSGAELALGRLFASLELSPVKTIYETGKGKKKKRGIKKVVG